MNEVIWMHLKISKRGRVALTPFNADVAKQLRSWQRFTMQDRVTLRMVRSTRAGDRLAWLIHGGWVLFPQPFLVSEAEGQRRCKNEEEREDGEEK